MVRATVGMALGPYGSEAVAKALEVYGATASARAAGYAWPHNLHELVLDAIPAATGLIGFLWTRNVLQANCIGLTTAAALHVLRLAMAENHQVSLHPLVIGATLASAGVLGAALAIGPLGGVLGITAPSPIGWVLIGGGIAVMALVHWLSTQHPDLAALSMPAPALEHAMASSG